MTAGCRARSLSFVLIVEALVNAGTFCEPFPGIKPADDIQAGAVHAWLDPLPTHRACRGPQPIGYHPRRVAVFRTLYVNLTQDHCDGLIRDHLGEEVVAQASS